MPKRLQLADSRKGGPLDLADQRIDTLHKRLRALIAHSLAGEAAGDLVSDAYLAVVATGLSAELVSADRDFARFPGLRWSRPFER